ncbi:MAG: ribonuclease P protein component [Proteobacteria bacterium]|nr:ribonuclease P protein component [Pseudomonadota bacterium]
MSAADECGADSTFPKTARLRTPGEFKAVFEHGRRVSGGMFRLHILTAAVADPEGAQKVARLGISVPKRIAALAVERNRIRRIVRESFRHQRASIPAGDYALVAQRESRGATADALRTALASLWRRAGALKPATSTPTMPHPRHQRSAASTDPSPVADHPSESQRPQPETGTASRAPRDPQDDTPR